MEITYQHSPEVEEARKALRQILEAMDDRYLRPLKTNPAPSPQEVQQIVEPRDRAIAPILGALLRLEQAATSTIILRADDLLSSLASAKL